MTDANLHDLSRHHAGDEQIGTEEGDVCCDTCGEIG